MPILFNARRVGTSLPNSVYIGRPSKWGNPFRIGEGETRDDVIERFEDWLIDNPDLIAEAQIELRGKNLICWCSPKRCHGDVWMHYANLGP